MLIEAEFEGAECTLGRTFHMRTGRFSTADGLSVCVAQVIPALSST